MTLSPNWYNVFSFALATEFIIDFVKSFFPIRLNSRFDKCASFLCALLMIVPAKFSLFEPAGLWSYVITTFVTARLSYILHDRIN